MLFRSVFEQAGDSVVIEVEEGSSEDARIVLIAGLPLDQKVSSLPASPLLT